MPYNKYRSAYHAGPSTNNRGKSMFGSSNQRRSSGPKRRGQYIDPTRFVKAAIAVEPADEYVAMHEFAEFEADLIRARTREGMKVAKAKGRLRGKSPKLTPRQEAHLLQLHAADEHTVGELAELFSVGRSTVYRALQRAERGRENALQ